MFAGTHPEFSKFGMLKKVGGVVVRG